MPLYSSGVFRAEAFSPLLAKRKKRHNASFCRIKSKEMPTRFAGGVKNVNLPRCRLLRKVKNENETVEGGSVSSRRKICRYGTHPFAILRTIIPCPDCVPVPRRTPAAVFRTQAMRAGGGRSQAKQICRIAPKHSDCYESFKEIFGCQEQRGAVVRRCGVDVSPRVCLLR